MNWQHITYFISIIIAVAVMGFIAWYSRKRRDTVAGAGVYQWIAFLASLLSIFQGLSMIGFSSEWARFWYDMRIVCFAVIPVLWLVFVLYFVGKSEWISKVRIAVLFIIPVVTQVMLWTNDMHGLWVIHNVSFRSAGPFFIPVLESRVPGPWFVVHNIYTYGMMMVGFVILFVLSVRLQSLYRGQVVALGTGTLIMMIGALVPTLNLFPGMELNPLPQCFAIGSLVIAWGLYRHQFLVASPKYDDDKRIPGVIVMLFVIVTVGILSVGFLYYRQHQNQFRAEVGRTLSSIAELKVSELVQWRKERLADADSLHGNIAFANLMRRIISNPADGDAYRQMRTWLEKIRASYRYDHVVLLDVRGTARLSVPQSVEPLCANVRQQTAEIMRTGRITFLDFHQEAPGKPIHLAVVVPIVEQGHPMGLVALFIDPTAYLFPLLNRWPTPSRTAETLLVRRDGNDVLFLNELRFRKNTALSLRIPLVDERVPAVMAALGREGVVEGIDYRGVPVAAAIRAVPGSPWVMVARMDLAEVYAPLREWLWLMIVLVCAILAGAGSGVWLIWRRQSDRALKEKVETAELLRASENRYRRLFESAKDGILILDVVTGMIVDVNPYMIEMLGFSQEQFREKTIWDIGFLGDIIPNKEKFRELQEKGYVRYEGLPLETSDGRRIDVEFISNVYEIARGKVIQCNIRDISERIRMQRALLGVTSHQEALLSAIPDIVMEVDVNKVYTWSNGPGFEFFGDDVIGREAAYYFEGEQDTYRSVQPLFNGAEETIYLESWQRRRDGERRLLAWWCRVLKDEFGKVTGALSSARDVTESRQAEEAIRESEDKFRGIFDGSTVGKSLTAPDGTLLKVNRAFADMLGYSIEEMQQVNFAEITHPDDVAESRECIRCLLANEKEVYRMEKRYFGRDGGTVWADVSTRLHRLANGTPEYFITSIVNITQRKQAEEALRQSEQKLRRFYDSGLIGVIYWNMDGKIIDANDKFLEMVGYTRAELEAGMIDWIGMTPAEFSHLDEASVAELKTSGINRTPFEKEYMRKDGTRLPIVIAGAMLDDARFNGVAFLLDISERKRSEEDRRHFIEELVRSNVELQQFAYVASHDLQEPLRMISSYLQLIEKRYKDRLDADANDFINFAVDGASRLQSLISGLLEFSRVKSHGSSFGRVDVKSVLDNLRRDLTMAIGDTGAVIEYGDMPVITADGAQISRLFLNLIQNAIKFRHVGTIPQVVISSEKRGNDHVFSIRDNGLGIEDQYFERIFVIFQRLHGREEYPGTGIGLAICKRIVERHGGRIWVESKFGEGSTFHFSIPDVSQGGKRGYRDYMQQEVRHE